MKGKKLDLFILSIVILATAAFALVQSIVNVAINGFAIDAASLGEGMTITPEVATIIGVIGFAIGVIFLLPQVFVGIRGMQNAKGPMEKQGHITWTKVLFVFAIISAVAAIISAFTTNDLLNSIINIATNIVNVCIYYFYIKYAKAINKAE